MSQDKDTEQKLEENFKQLHESIENGNYKDGLKNCEEILNISPEDKEAIKTQVFLFINLNRISDVLNFLEEKDSCLQENDIAYEKAYCLYRNNNFEKALEIVKDYKDKSYQHLKAQILYRMGDYNAAASEYEKIINVRDIEEVVNLSAAYTSGEQSHEGLKATKRCSDTTHELNYNAACAAIDMHSFDMAQELLNNAIEQCKKDLGDNPDELENELSVLRVQNAFLEQLQHENAEDPTQVYSQAVSNPKSRGVTLAVAANNLIASKSDDYVDQYFLMKRHARKRNIDPKLTERQQRGIWLNYAKLLIVLKKFDECREFAHVLLKAYPYHDAPHLIKATLEIMLSHDRNAKQILHKFLDKKRGYKVAVALSLAQIYIDEGKHRKALDVLRSCPENTKFKPGVAGAVFSLLRKVKKTEAFEFLDSFVQYLSEQFKQTEDKSAKREIKSVLKSVGQYHLNENDVERSAHVFETVYNLDNSDSKALAGLVAALSQFDLEKAEKFSSQLPEVNVQGMNMDMLENEVMQIQPGQRPTLSSHKKNRKRKSRLPKNSKPEQKPDPERWLPKEERSGYKGKKGIGSQGTSNVAQVK
eukprot:gb/GECH01014815.1/.p1 GENE.gb/GECH01014815.1/~~gb/GECH01014815.1/.p1  ORF type:complete len:587 (+),score=173.03 gb/GECH01014815.1/:1-1761(+)